MIGLWTTSKALLCLCLCVWVVEGLDLYEGDICKEEGGVLWTCRPLKDCPKAQALRQGNNRPQLCNDRMGAPVCCEPETRPAGVPAGTKSKQMCKKYAQSVYIKLEDPIGDGYVEYDTCSLVEPLITGGKDAEAKEYPHMALIGYGEEDSIIWYCGGTLISERFILSAAHCTNIGEKSIASWVKLGDYNIATNDDEVNGLSMPQLYRIIDRINHPGYRSPSKYYDIALYRLDADVQFSEYIRPICIQTQHHFPQTYAVATGWGRTQAEIGKGSDILQKVNLTITPRKTCSDAYRGAIGNKLSRGILDESMLCAGDIGKDTCQGDSGGPLQVVLKEPYCMYSQIGITSFGEKCAQGKPGVYTRVSYYVPWIESVVWP